MNINPNIRPSQNEISVPAPEVSQKWVKGSINKASVDQSAKTSQVARASIEKILQGLDFAKVQSHIYRTFLDMPLVRNNAKIQTTYLNSLKSEIKKLLDDYKTFLDSKPSQADLIKVRNEIQKFLEQMSPNSERSSFFAEKLLAKEEKAFAKEQLQSLTEFIMNTPHDNTFNQILKTKVDETKAALRILGRDNVKGEQLAFKLVQNTVKDALQTKISLENENFSKVVTEASKDINKAISRFENIQKRNEILQNYSLRIEEGELINHAKVITEITSFQEKHLPKEDHIVPIQILRQLIDTREIDQMIKNAESKQETPQQIKENSINQEIEKLMKNENVQIALNNFSEKFAKGDTGIEEKFIEYLLQFGNIEISDKAQRSLIDELHKRSNQLKIDDLINKTEKLLDGKLKLTSQGVGTVKTTPWKNLFKFKVSKETYNSLLNMKNQFIDLIKNFESYDTSHQIKLYNSLINLNSSPWFRKAVDQRFKIGSKREILKPSFEGISTVLERKLNDKMQTDPEAASLAVDMFASLRANEKIDKSVINESFFNQVADKFSQHLEVERNKIFETLMDHEKYKNPYNSYLNLVREQIDGIKNMITTSPNFNGQLENFCMMIPANQQTSERIFQKSITNYIIKLGITAALEERGIQNLPVSEEALAAYNTPSLFEGKEFEGKQEMVKKLISNPNPEALYLYYNPNLL